MNLTRRGRAVLGVVVLGFLMAGLHGPRALNAVVAPALIALGAGLLMVRRVSRPAIERVPPDDGFVDEEREVVLSVETDSSFTGRVVDHVSDGLTAADNDVLTTVDGDPIEYDLHYTSRGDHQLGPIEVTVRDVLGLVERRFEYTDRETVLVYPPVRDLGNQARRELQALPEFRLVSVRGEFDSLREYERGDALRDIDWKSSAKQTDDELVVKEYTDQDDLGSISVVGESARDADATDAMAEATASIVAFLLDANLTIGVSVPEGVVDPGTGNYQRQQVLELLARTDGGKVPSDERREADVHIEGRRDGTVTVRIEDQLVPFESLTGTAARNEA